MSSQSRQHQTDVEQEVLQSTTISPAQNGPGNAANMDQAQTEEGTAAGLANYQATLGQWLGTELYHAVVPELTLDRIANHADKGLMMAIEATMGSIDPTSKSHADLIEKLTQGLKEEYATIASEWIQENGQNLSNRLANWVDANPVRVVTAALLAAAGAIIANLPIPQLKQKFRLGDNFSGGLGADIGRFRDISLKSISAELSWTTAPLVAAVKTTHHLGGDTETTVNARTGTEEHHISAEGQFVNTDLQIFNLQGVMKNGPNTYTATAEHDRTDGINQTTLSANVTTEQGDTKEVSGVRYDPQTGALTVEKILDLSSNGLDTQWRQTTSSTGSSTNSLDISGAVSDSTNINLSLEDSAQLLGVGSSYELTRSQQASLGVDYTGQDLDTAMEMAFNNQGTGSVSSSLDLHLGNNWSTGGDAKVEWGNTDYLEAGAYFGFRDPNEFKTYMTRYRFKSGDESVHELDLLIEDKFGPIYTRLQQQVAFGAMGMSYETTAQGAYFFNDNFALIGGAQYRQNDMGEKSLAPQLGAQIYGIPLVVTHDSQTGTTSIGVTLKFGRK